MNANEPLFWLVIITAIIALSFLMIAGAMIAIAVFVKRAVKLVNRLEERFDPLITRATAISEQGSAIAVQGRQIAEQFNVMSGHLSTATANLAESTALIKEEVRGIITLADETKAHIRYVSTQVYDQSQNALLYRRDLCYLCEYTMLSGTAAPVMLFGNLFRNGNSSFI